MPDKHARRPERKRLHNRTTRRHRAESPAITRTTCENRQPAATATASAPFRYRHLAARPVPALPSPSLTRHCTGILHRHDIIPVSCGQLREQRAFSLYRQRLAPPAHQTGISGVPSPRHSCMTHHGHKKTANSLPRGGLWMQGDFWRSEHIIDCQIAGDTFSLTGISLYIGIDFPCAVGRRAEGHADFRYPCVSLEAVVVQRVAIDASSGCP